MVTYCLMSNHSHLLPEVPDRGALAPLDEEGLLAVLPRLHDAVTVEGVRQELERARQAGDERWHREILDRYERRRGDLSLFLKELKLRVTFYMNKRLGRTGTLWEGRYKSVLVEDTERALLTMAAYIDLNPVRAGLAKTPEDYRWCGYAEALSGRRGAKAARGGLGRMLGEALQDGDFKHDWRRTAALPDVPLRGRPGGAPGRGDGGTRTAGLFGGGGRGGDRSAGGDVRAPAAAAPGAVFLRRGGAGDGRVRQRGVRARAGPASALRGKAQDGGEADARG